MAPTSSQTVFGFGSDLDWRPTCFVNPFPPSRVCSVCGLVPSSAAMLACRHLLCQTCYEGVGGNRYHCPLDQEPFQEEDVVWTTIGRDSILSRKVRCWNAEHGCDAEGVASAMLEHFTNACQFHVVRCPRCSEAVLHRDITVHLVSCGEPSRTTSEQQPVGDNFANAFMEVKEALGKILQENVALRTKLDSFQFCVRSEANGSFATQSPSIADAVADAVERRISVFTSQAEAALPVYQAVKEALNKLSESNAAVQTKLESLEEHLDMDSAMAHLSTIVSRALRVAVEKTTSVCRAGTEAALADRWRVAISEFRDTMAGNERTMKEVISQECERNMLGLKDMIAEAMCGDRRLANSAPSLPETTEKREDPLQDEVKALELLAVVSLSINSDFLCKSVPYEWTINDWAGFCVKAPLSAQYITGNDGQPRYHYGYLIVPRLCFSSSKVWLHAIVIEGLFDRFLKWPLDKNIKLIFINPCDSTKELTVQSAVSHVRTKPHLECSKKVMFVGRSDKIPVETLDAFNVIGNNKLRLRLEFEW